MTSLDATPANPVRWRSSTPSRQFLYSVALSASFMYFYTECIPGVLTPQFSMDVLSGEALEMI